MKLAMGTGNAGGVASDSAGRSAAGGATLRGGVGRSIAAGAELAVSREGLLTAGLEAFGVDIRLGLAELPAAVLAALFAGLALVALATFPGALAFFAAAATFFAGFEGFWAPGRLFLPPVGFRSLARVRAAGLRDFVALAMGVHANVCEGPLSNGTDCRC